MHIITLATIYRWAV